VLANQSQSLQHHHSQLLDEKSQQQPQLQPSSSTQKQDQLLPKLSNSSHEAIDKEADFYKALNAMREAELKGSTQLKPLQYTY